VLELPFNPWSMMTLRTLAMSYPLLSSTTLLLTMHGMETTQVPCHPSFDSNALSVSNSSVCINRHHCSPQWRGFCICPLFFSVTVYTCHSSLGL
jgi:hypothetical protein